MIWKRRPKLQRINTLNPTNKSNKKQTNKSIKKQIKSIKKQSKTNQIKTITDARKHYVQYKIKSLIANSSGNAVMFYFQFWSSLSPDVFCCLDDISTHKKLQCWIFQLQLLLLMVIFSNLQAILGKGVGSKFLHESSLRLYEIDTIAFNGWKKLHLVQQGVAWTTMVIRVAEN